MIKLLVANTHSKFVYDDPIEKKKYEKFIKEKLTVTDPKLLRDPMVLRGIKSANVCFYDNDHQIIPSGLVPHSKIYSKKEGWDVDVQDLRKFPKQDAVVKQAILDGEFSVGNKQLRDYQIDAMTSIVKYKGGIVEAGTGAGKSLIIAATCKLYSHSKILIIFNRVELVDQTYKGLLACGFNRDEIGIISGGQYDDEKRITLLTMQSYGNIFHLFPTIGVVISDECHETGRAPTAEKIIYSCQNAAVKIGFSATVGAIDNEYERFKLYGNLGPIIFKKDYSSLRDEGTLANVSIVMHHIDKEKHIGIVGSWNDIYDTIKVKDATDIPQLEKDGYEIKKEGKDTIARKFQEYGDESLLYTYNESRNALIAKIALSNERVLILFSKIAHGKELKKLMPNAILLSGENDRLSRDAAKKDLAKNKNAIILASDIFSVGVDIPAIKNLILAGSSVGSVKVIQRIGRTTRKDDATKKLSATVHDFMQESNALSRRQSLKRKKVYEEILKIPVSVILSN